MTELHLKAEKNGTLNFAQLIFSYLSLVFEIAAIFAVIYVKIKARSNEYES